jgi:hypothetical protein
MPSSQKYGLDPGSGKKLILDPGRGKKAPYFGSGSATATLIREEG